MIPFSLLCIPSLWKSLLFTLLLFVSPCHSFAALNLLAVLTSLSLVFSSNTLCWSLSNENLGFCLIFVSPCLYPWASMYASACVNMSLSFILPFSLIKIFNSGEQVVKNCSFNIKLSNPSNVSSYPAKDIHCLRYLLNLSKNWEQVSPNSILLSLNFCLYPPSVNLNLFNNCSLRQL